MYTEDISKYLEDIKEAVRDSKKHHEIRLAAAVEYSLPFAITYNTEQITERVKRLEMLDYLTKLVSNQ